MGGIRDGWGEQLQVANSDVHLQGMNCGNPNDHSDAETERLETLRHYEILDTPPDGAFDRVTALAARFFNVPISLVSLVDEDRIWFKSRFGLDVSQIDRSPGLCASAIFSESAYVVKITQQDEEDLKAFADMVLDQMELRLSARQALSSLTNLLKKDWNLDEYLTMCAWSRKIRVEGEWMSFDEFLTRRLGIPVTHGIHPDIVKTMLEKLDDPPPR